MNLMKKLILTIIAAVLCTSPVWAVPETMSLSGMNPISDGSYSLLVDLGDIVIYQGGPSQSVWLHSQTSPISVTVQGFDWRTQIYKDGHITYEGNTPSSNPYSVPNTWALAWEGGGLGPGYASSGSSGETEAALSQQPTELPQQTIELTQGLTFQDGQWTPNQP